MIGSCAGGASPKRIKCDAIRYEESMIGSCAGGASPKRIKCDAIRYEESMIGSCGRAASPRRINVMNPGNNYKFLHGRGQK